MADANGEQGSINLDDLKDIDIDLSGEEDPLVLKEHAAKATKFARQVVARAKKAEADNKLLKENPTPGENKTVKSSSDTNKPVLTADDVDIRVLRAQKVPEDEIKYLQKIAALNGTSVIEAQSDDVFIAWKGKREEAEKAEKASLGASKGSGSAQREEEINTPGLSDAKHKELWKAQTSK